jgi:hypothetical protein
MRRLDSAAIAWLLALGLAASALVGFGTYLGLTWLREAASRARARAAQDTRSADEAYQDLWRALEQRDATEAARYVPAARLRTLKSGDDVISSLLVLSPVKDMRVARATTSGDKAVLFVKASSQDVTDAKGRPAPIDVVVRMAREDGHWKVHFQRWLVATPPATEQREALAWLKGAR